jgi:hypothetical protein
MAGEPLWFGSIPLALFNASMAPTFSNTPVSLSDVDDGDNGDSRISGPSFDRSGVGDALWQ